MTNMIVEQSEDFQKELAALARIVTFARQSASDLNVAFPTYFLDMALAAVLDEMKIAGVDVSSVAGTAEFVQIKGYH